MGLHSRSRVPPSTSQSRRLTVALSVCLPSALSQPPMKVPHGKSATASVPMRIGQRSTAAVVRLKSAVPPVSSKRCPKKCTNDNRTAGESIEPRFQTPIAPKPVPKSGLGAGPDTASPGTKIAPESSERDETAAVPPLPPVASGGRTVGGGSGVVPPAPPV